MPILVFLGLSVLDLGEMYATDVRRRQTDVRHASSLNAPYPMGGGIIMQTRKHETAIINHIVHSQENVIAVPH